MAESVMSVACFAQSPTNPNYVVVVDATLLTTVGATSGFKKDGAIIVKTSKT
jgi:hypothetical protein